MHLCIECMHFIDGVQSDKCDNAELPMHDYVYGIRHCYLLNPKGECKGFKEKSKPESIYETKEDEKLAKPGQAILDEHL